MKRIVCLAFVLFVGFSPYAIAAPESLTGPDGAAPQRDFEPMPDFERPYSRVPKVRINIEEFERKSIEDIARTLTGEDWASYNAYTECQYKRHQKSLRGVLFISSLFGAASFVARDLYEYEECKRKHPLTPRAKEYQRAIALVAERRNLLDEKLRRLEVY
ncbi:MAG: hypothetical protein JAY90_19520 [Candidatus Thiodiazotropha lotti]|nr:hypothetical protein [Candidatus Thiodiazotropha lotti]